MPNVKDLQRQFAKPELLDIASELGIKAKDKSALDIINLILADVEANGVPEIDDCSDVLAEFLITAEIMDADGNLIEQAEVPKPPCFGYEDKRDPACNQCKLQSECRKWREDHRPECYGKYSSTAPECVECIEAASCKLLVNKKERI